MNSLSNKPLGLGLVGIGSFGRFCVEQYAGMEAVSPLAVADASAEAAGAIAETFGLDACASVDDLMAREDVDLIYIAAPPVTHGELGLAALKAGKHVLCEKPLATDLETAREMAEVARELERVLAVNLIMRYNPLCQCVKQILDKGLIGAPLHAFFENYAKDEPLPEGHWFWNREVRGGIFIEHGVHFFDLFRMWFGPGEVHSAEQSLRPGTDSLVEQVVSTARYGAGVLAQFYHGFHQAERMDRQEMGIVCERGSIRLFEWVPTRLEIDCLADRASLEALEATVPNAVVKEIEKAEGEALRVRSRHKSYEVGGRYLIRGDVGMPKMSLYAKVVRDLMSDQVAAMRDPNHRRQITEENGLTSLEMAVRADQLARGESPK